MFDQKNLCTACWPYLKRNKPRLCVMQWSNNHSNNNNNNNDNTHQKVYHTYTLVTLSITKFQMSRDPEVQKICGMEQSKITTFYWLPTSSLFMTLWALNKTSEPRQTNPRPLYIITFHQSLDDFVTTVPIFDYTVQPSKYSVSIK